MLGKVHFKSNALQDCLNLDKACLFVPNNKQNKIHSSHTSGLEMRNIPLAEGNVNSCLNSRGRSSNKLHEEYDAGEESSTLFSNNKNKMETCHFCLHRVYTGRERHGATKYYKTHYNQWFCLHWMRCGATQQIPDSKLLKWTLVELQWTMPPEPSLFKSCHSAAIFEMPLGHPSAAWYGETSNSPKLFTTLKIKFHIWNHQWNRTTTVS